MSDDGKDDERFKNMALYHFWGTDKEFEEAAPGILIGALVIVVGILLAKAFHLF